MENGSRRRKGRKRMAKTKNQILEELLLDTRKLITEVYLDSRFILPRLFTRVKKFRTLFHEENMLKNSIEYHKKYLKSLVSLHINILIKLEKIKRESTYEWDKDFGHRYRSRYVRVKK